MAKKGKGNDRSGRRDAAHVDHTKHTWKSPYEDTKRSPNTPPYTGSIDEDRTPGEIIIDLPDSTYTDRPAGEIIINPPDDPHPTSGS